MDEQTRHTNHERFTLRLPRDVHAAVRARAVQENRSVNQQVVRLLQLALNGDLKRTA